MESKAKEAGKADANDTAKAGSGEFQTANQGAQGTTDANAAGAGSGDVDADKTKLKNTTPPAGDKEDNDEPSAKEIKKALDTLKKDGIVHIPAAQKEAFEEAIKADERFAESSWGTNTTDEQTAFKLNL